jgi:PKD repeat protein
MKNLSFCLLAILLLPVNCMLAQESINDNTALKELKERGEIYFQFELDLSQSLDDISKIISIDKVSSTNINTIFAYANLKEFTKFLQLDIDYQILEHPGSLIKDPKMLLDLSAKSTNSWDFYPSYQVYVQMMYQFQTDYPGLCQIVNIGQTINGRDLLYAKISDNVGLNEAEPRFNYTSTMHGDETAGFVLMLRLIDHLLSNYGIDPEATQLVNSVEIWINPNANPDGTYIVNDSTVSGAIRYNANYVDLNRNFPDFQDGPNPDGNPWQIETLNMMDLADSIHFVKSANFHGGAEVLNYPWDTFSTLHADNSWWIYVCGNYADTVHAYSTSGYLTDLNNGITNGYAWYTTNGSRQDYMNYYHRCRETTIELSAIKNPAASTLPNFWNYNYRSLLAFINEVNYGVKGIVTDSVTGDPLYANVLITAHDAYQTDVYTELPHGDYYRPIYAGSYDLTYSSPGYQSKTITVVVVNGAATIQDVQLTQIAPQVSFDAEETSSCIGIIQFIDQTNTSPGSTYLWDFGDGNTSSDQNPQHEYTINGTFSVSLTVTNTIGTSSEVQNSFITINRPAVPLAESDSICGFGTVSLLASATNEIYWYDDSLATSLVHIGDTLVTPVLSASTVYYAQNTIAPPVLSAAKPDNSGGGGYYMNSSSHHLVFDCYSAVTLVSVKVYADFTADRTITLRDNQGNVLDETTVLILAGEQTVALGFSIPAGTDLELVGPPVPGLYRNNSGLSYPYDLAGYISVKHSSATSDPTGYYYYFYDWKIQEETCKSALIPVAVEVFPAAPIASFTSFINQDTVSFTNSTSNGGLYSWDFGDGTTSNLQNPTHIYQTSGTFNVSLSVSNSCGSDTYSEVINVLLTVIQSVEDENQIFIYPNPASSSVSISWNESGEKSVSEITISNSLGQRVYTKHTSSIENKIELDISNWNAGLYLIRLKENNRFISSGFIVE